MQKRLSLSSEFLLSDPMLEEVRLFVLGAGKFNIEDVHKKFKVGLLRTYHLRDSLIAEGIIDKTEVEGQYWLAGSSVVFDIQNELDEVVGKLVSVVGPIGTKNFDDLVKVMAVDRASVMRLVIIAGIRALFGTLGQR